MSCPALVLSQTNLPCPGSPGAQSISTPAVHPTHPFSGHGKWGVEPLLKSAAALKNGRQEEVEQGPQLRQLVLQRSASEEETTRSNVVGVQHLGQLAMVVLHTVTFIHNHILPTNLYIKQ